MLIEGPVLDKIYIDKSILSINKKQYPFTINHIKNFKEITFEKQVTFFVGENGSGKSTWLEAIATGIGFGKDGGSKNINSNVIYDKKIYDGIDAFSKQLRFSWRKKVRDGYFFRAETFFNLVNEIERIAHEGGTGAYSMYSSYGGKSLHKQSHGESFLNLFKERLGGGGIYILDEPESALSPQKQLSLLAIIHELCKNSETQFIIATHSPMLLAYPDSTIFSFDNKKVEEIKYTDTKHYQITKDFLNNTDLYFKHLFN